MNEKRVSSCRKYDQALEYHRQALVLIPQHASTYAAIGYVHSLMGDFESAIDYFHTVNVPQLPSGSMSSVLGIIWDKGFFSTSRRIAELYFKTAEDLLGVFPLSGFLGRTGSLVVYQNHLLFSLSADMSPVTFKTTCWW